jgi:hypothetical protein
MVEIAIDDVSFPQPQAFEHGEIARQADRDRRKNNVEGNRKTELDARQFKRR